MRAENSPCGLAIGQPKVGRALWVREVGGECIEVLDPIFAQGETLRSKVWNRGGERMIHLLTIARMSRRRQALRICNADDERLARVRRPRGAEQRPRALIFYRSRDGLDRYVLELRSFVLSVGELLRSASRYDDSWALPPAPPGYCT